jgi:hypothetical protein
VKRGKGRAIRNRQEEKGRKETEKGVKSKGGRSKGGRREERVKI